ncbi:MAG TPA: hypothetical protein VMR80_03545 [Candidatus Acidoferrum sp.]|nr:hypothetical protein [Candidatus Acidoferrum sp.]
MDGAENLQENETTVLYGFRRVIAKSERQEWECQEVVLAIDSKDKSPTSYANREKWGSSNVANQD